MDMNTLGIIICCLLIICLFSIAGFMCINGEEHPKLCKFLFNTPIVLGSIAALLILYLFSNSHIMELGW